MQHKLLLKVNGHAYVAIFYTNRDELVNQSPRQTRRALFHNVVKKIRNTNILLGSKCFFAQGNNTPTRLRIEPGSPDPESNLMWCVLGMASG